MGTRGAPSVGWAVACLGLLSGCLWDEATELDAEGVGIAAGTIKAAQDKHPAALELKAEVISADEEQESLEPPEGYVRMTPRSTSGPSFGNAVVLYDAAEEVAVPIFIGGTEALSTQLRLAKRRYKRPLTHDLLDSMLARLDVKMVRAQVDRLEDNIYFGTVVLRQGDKVMTFDSRPSDAMALAIGNQVPIYVSQQVLDRAGVKLDELDNRKPEPGSDPISL